MHPVRYSIELHLHGPSPYGDLDESNNESLSTRVKVFVENKFSEVEGKSKREMITIPAMVHTWARAYARISTIWPQIMREESDRVFTRKVVTYLRSGRIHAAGL